MQLIIDNLMLLRYCEILSKRLNCFWGYENKVKYLYPHFHELNHFFITL